MVGEDGLSGLVYTDYVAYRMPAFLLMSRCFFFSGGLEHNNVYNI